MAFVAAVAAAVVVMMDCRKNGCCLQTLVAVVVAKPGMCSRRLDQLVVALSSGVDPRMDDVDQLGCRTALVKQMVIVVDRPGHEP